MLTLVESREKHGFWRRKVRCGMMVNQVLPVCSRIVPLSRLNVTCLVGEESNELTFGSKISVLCSNKVTAYCRVPEVPGAELDLSEVR